ncbi:proteinase-activated receptor 3-like isoform X1 [Hypanus sabinus]|uniref:proteinase-activated receptor 3-like isoform X1 n=2 Tax=Hypanus sabinus TaxID=79690 RepID=UPI0028C44209|nr:proteinase-activated receptor 3-like isoform X1 [Hypanus sabinus]
MLFHVVYTNWLLNDEFSVGRYLHPYTLKVSSHTIKQEEESSSCEDRLQADTYGDSSESESEDVTRPTKGSVNNSEIIHSMQNESARYYLTSSITTVVIPVISSIIVIIGLPANGLALLVLATKVRRVPSTIFLMNLATADLLLILVLPFKIHYHFQGNNWIFGEALCRTMTAFFYGNMYCSILLLTFISVDRYFALVHPFYSRRFRDNRSAVAICSILWTIVAFSVLPFLLQRQVYPIQDLNIKACHDALPESMNSGYFFYYFVCLVVVEFLIPCLVTVFCYVSVIKTLMSNDRKYVKAVRAIILTLIIYVVCFTPSKIILLIHYSEYHLMHSSGLYLYYIIFLELSTLNNCIDPFIFYYFSVEFRGKVERSVLFFKKKPKIKEKSGKKLSQPKITSGVRVSTPLVQSKTS